MLNRDKVRKTTLNSTTQILANVEMQASVGCIVDDAIGILVNGAKIVKAGTPLRVVFATPQTPAVLATAAVIMNAILLHDVDVTSGDANGTALIFGFVNTKRIDATTNALLTTARVATASPLLTFLTI